MKPRKTGRVERREREVFQTMARESSDPPMPEAQARPKTS